MTDPGATCAPAEPEPGSDLAARIDVLRARGAERFDPVRFRFIEAMARRAVEHGIEARHVLDRKLAQALSEFHERFDRAARRAAETVAHGTARFPEAAEALAQDLDTGDYGGLHRLLARLEARGDSGPLTELLAHVARHATEGAPQAPGQGAGVSGEAEGELRSVRRFRSTWAKLSIDRQLSQAFAQAPENAGPLNSHHLVLQSLGLMRDIAPEYLEQFVSYVDTLLWLEQVDGARAPAPKSAGRSEAARKRKSGRGGPG